MDVDTLQRVGLRELFAQTAWRSKAGEQFGHRRGIYLMRNRGLMATSNTSWPSSASHAKEPYGPSPLAWRPCGASGTRRPVCDEACRSLRRAARHHRVEPDMVLVGQGTRHLLASTAGAGVPTPAGGHAQTRNWPLYQWVVEECGTGVPLGETASLRDLVVDRWRGWATASAVLRLHGPTTLRHV